MTTTKHLTAIDLICQHVPSYNLDGVYKAGEYDLTCDVDISTDILDDGDTHDVSRVIKLSVTIDSITVHYIRYSNNAMTGDWDLIDANLSIIDWLRTWVDSDSELWLRDLVV